MPLEMPMRALSPLALVLLLGCPPKVEESDTEDITDTDTDVDVPDTDTDPGDTDTDVEPPEPSEFDAGVIVATTDYSVGAVEVVDINTWDIEVTPRTTLGDPKVFVDTWLDETTDPNRRVEVVFQVDRSGSDTIRVFWPDPLTSEIDWSAPFVEFSVGDGANVQDVEVCDNKLFVTMYDRDYIGIYSLLDGALFDTIDLSSYNDADGFPEAASLVESDLKLYVALEMLDRSTWQPSGPGKIVEINCPGRNTIREWDTGPSPSIYFYPLNPTKLVVRTGMYTDESGTIALDGGLQLLDMNANTMGDMKVTEEEIGANITDFSAHAGQGGAAAWITSDENYESAIYCTNLNSFNPNGPYEQGLGYFADLETDWQKWAWVAVQAGWADPTGPEGLMVFDLATCTNMTSTGLLETQLPPYALAVY